MALVVLVHVQSVSSMAVEVVVHRHRLRSRRLEDRCRPCEVEPLVVSVLENEMVEVLAESRLDQTENHRMVDSCLSEQALVLSWLPEMAV